MNTVTGRIAFEDTSVGIPNLLVSIYDLDPNSNPEEIFNLSQSLQGLDFWTKIPGDRIGSVLTDSEGNFGLTYEDSEFQIRNREQRPDLILLVTAPEERDHKACPLVLHLSCGMRQNAGRTESFFIRLKAEQLKQAGILVPGGLAEEPEAVIRGMVEEAERENKIAEAGRKIAEKKIETKRKLNKEIDKKLEKFYESLSSVTELQKKELSFVSPGESVEAKNIELIADGIRNIVNKPDNRATVKGHLKLTEAQRKELEASADVNGNIPGEIVDNIFLENSGGQEFSTVLIRQDPLMAVCRDKSEDEKCAEIALEITLDGEIENETPALPEDTDVTGNGISSVSIEEDIPRYIARLMESATSPEEPVSFGITAQKDRADQTTVQQNIEALSLRSGPADIPAIYEFHHLQVAFEHVWQEAIDQGVLDIASDAYRRLVELGIDPDEVVSEDEECPKVNDSELGTAPNPDLFCLFDITWEQWNALSGVEQDTLTILAATCGRAEDDVNRQRAEQWGNRMIRYATSKLIAGSGEYDQLHELLKDLKNRLRSNYSFTAFAADCKERSINFGILVTYRQKWEPITYQVGELVKTITLAPKEVRKISKKIVQKKKRAEKEVEKTIISQREDATETSRADDQIIKKAQSKTNFSLSSEGTFNIGIYEGTATTSFSKEAQQSSDDIKKDFHESVVKSVHEYKQERNVEINTEESELFETVESGEIMNPNDELTVTFLFYELQRRYWISEQIHKAMPVIFVAQELPTPDQIDEAWAIIHGWIIRRVSLDDTLVLPALNYLSSNVVGDEVALKELRKNIEQQRRIVEELREELAAVRERANFLNSALELAIYQRAGLISSETDSSEGGSNGGGFNPIDPRDWAEAAYDVVTGAPDALLGGMSAAVKGFSDFFFGGNGGAGTRDRFDSARDVADRAAKRANEIRRILEREETALNSVTETYTKKLSDHLNRRTQISCLLAHIKENILYYMQAIWLHESIDQRSCRLRNVKVPVLEGTETYTVNSVPTSLPLTFPSGLEAYESEVTMDMDPDFEFTTLEEVADLNNLLGFMCNYMIFPLKESNALTEYMLEPYRDPIYELKDPDEKGNGNLVDFAKLVCCLEEKHPDKFEDLKAELIEQYEELAGSFSNGIEEIVVPTESLYIEALPGAHPILEDFKLVHRAIDVKKVQSEVREWELENVRLAARLLKGEFEDPDIDKKVLIQGDAGTNISIDADDS